MLFLGGERKVCILTGGVGERGRKKTGESERTSTPALGRPLRSLCKKDESFSRRAASRSGQTRLKKFTEGISLRTMGKTVITSKKKVGLYARHKRGGHVEKTRTPSLTVTKDNALALWRKKIVGLFPRGSPALGGQHVVCLAGRERVSREQEGEGEKSSCDRRSLAFL